VSDFDVALASLRLWAVEVDLGGRTYRIPPLPASEWFAAVLSGEGGPIVPGLLGVEDQEDIIDAMLAGEVSLAQLETANHDALAAASGWKWWEAERLIASAAAQWKVIGGLLQGAGLDMSTAPLGAVLSSMYAMAVTHMKREDKFAFDAQISAPPPGRAREWFDESAYADNFAQLLRAHQSKTLPAPDK
jgi:hypothetical protein